MKNETIVLPQFEGNDRIDTAEITVDFSDYDRMKNVYLLLEHSDGTFGVSFRKTELKQTINFLTECYEKLVVADMVKEIKQTLKTNAP